MKLVTKLIIMAVFTILIPMLIIMFFSAFMIYQSRAISQWEFLENIQNNIVIDVSKTESSYMNHIKEFAGNELIRDKMYVYEKYWNMLTENLREYDLGTVNNLIKDSSIENGIEVTVLYRREGDQFLPVAVNGENPYIPDVLYRKIAQPDYNKPVYRRYPDGIYLDIIYPVFSDGKLVGLVQFMRGFNDSFFNQYAEPLGFDYALISRNAVMLNSGTPPGEALQNTLTESGSEQRITFRSGSATYSGVVLPFALGGHASGQLLLYSERSSIFGEDSFLIQRLLLVTLLCILIPVITFFIKEIRLIRSINSLLAATNAISDGDYDNRVDVLSSDELGLLSKNFNDMVDVLKRNRAELEEQNKELSLKNSYIDAVFQSLRINIIVLDPDRKIQVVSKNAASRIELTDEHYQRRLLDISPFSDERKILGKTLEEVFESRKFSRLYSVKFGNTSYEIDFYPIVEADNSISAVVLILNNITERMNMERALIQSDKLASVGKLAAGLAHEINNPMSIILNHVQLLQSERLNDEEKTRFISRVESEIKRVSKLINNLLKFSREEQLQAQRIGLGEVFSEVIGLFDPKSKAVDVSDYYDGYNIVNAHAKSYGMIYREKHITFFVSADLEGGFVFCVLDSLKQILFNIIKNAFDSCADDNCIITAGLQKTPEGTKISLHDNGCGISDDELVNVFELFYTKGKPGTGVGLGLPLCKKLMNNIGGEIGIDSKKGQGTTVTMLFPDREGFYG